MSRSHEKSIELYERAKEVMPAGVSSHLRSLEKPVPLSFSQAQGAKMFDVDGNVYIDYVLGLGPLILGHTPPRVIEAVAAAMNRGQVYAGQHELETQVAETLVEVIDCAEMVRFALSGTDVTQLSLRLAKAFTGRSKIIKFEGHYHGWADNVYVSAWVSPPQLGDRSKPPSILHSQGQSSFLAEETIVLPWNDADILESVLERRGKEVAGIIMEPAMCNSGGIWPRPGYLEAVREMCHRHGVVLIFDEVISGFRFHPGGLQTLLGVTPDLTTLGKAMAGGFPVSALVGRRDIMKLIAGGEVMHAGTFNGNVVGLAAARETLSCLRENDGQIHREMTARGKRLMSGLRERAVRYDLPVLVSGRETAFHVHFTPRRELFEYRDLLDNDGRSYNVFQKRLMELGVRLIFRGNWYLSAAHSDEEIEYTLNQVDRALEEMSTRGGADVD
ncbi:MAG: aspartate aminotransferase family protein [Thermodesulfobacteriota bacterium]